MKTLKRFSQLFTGSSCPVLSELDDGQVCVLKLKGSGNGITSLASEFLVNRTCALLGWQVPDVFPVMIPEGFPWKFGTDEFDDLVQKSPGVNLGIRYVSDAVSVPGAEWWELNPSFLKQMAVVDSLFQNHDRSEKNLNVLRDQAGTCWLIDHGSCVFLDHPSGIGRFSLTPRHIMKAKEDEYLSRAHLLAPEIHQAIEMAVKDFPEAWLPELKITRAEMLTILLDRLTSWMTVKSAR